MAECDGARAVQCSVILVVLPASPFFLLDYCFDINQVFCRFRFCILPGHTHPFPIYSAVIFIPSEIHESSRRGIFSGYTTNADMRKYNRTNWENRCDLSITKIRDFSYVIIDWLTVYIIVACFICHFFMNRYNYAIIFSSECEEIEYV